MGLIRRIENGTTTEKDAKLVSKLVRTKLIPVLLVMIGLLLLGISLGGLLF